ncbi:hypothetical protein GWI33_019382 [Rhynchophorus ferrugineus]|uniref:Uncharacterized protein n=1 Tax=Rhynchophorus ferrugineus TaxID=354439 RepID=A0A834M1F3_RHYFE|nr:hypothetical protein GWI33_019382 [Rhynchophorus ferrugineus]
MSLVKVRYHTTQIVFTAIIYPTTLVVGFDALRRGTCPVRSGVTLCAGTTIEDGRAYSLVLTDNKVRRELCSIRARRCHFRGRSVVRKQLTWILKSRFTKDIKNIICCLYSVKSKSDSVTTSSVSRRNI